jgi:hypothetical protein
MSLRLGLEVRARKLEDVHSSASSSEGKFAVTVGPWSLHNIWTSSTSAADAVARFEASLQVLEEQNNEGRVLAET